MKTYKSLPLSLIACLSASLCHSYQTADSQKIDNAKVAVKDAAHKVADVAKDAASRAQKTAKTTVHEVAQAVEEKSEQIKQRTA